MKRSKGNSQRRGVPAIEQQQTVSDTTASRSGRRVGLRRGAWMLLMLLAALLLLVYMRWDNLQERWLEAQPVESLRQREERPDADTLVHYLYARRLVDTGSIPEAILPVTRAAHSLSAATSRDLSGRVLALAGYVAAQVGSEVNAEDWLGKAANLRPGDLFFLLGRGTLALHRRHAVEAVEALTEATHRDPTRAETWNALGNAFRLGGEPERAVEAHRTAIQLASGNARYHADLTQALQDARRFSEARQEARIAADLAPQNPTLAVLPAIEQAYAARTEPEYREAARLLQSAVDSHPADDRTRANLAGLQMRFRQYAAARQNLESILAHASNNGVCWHNLALVCERMGDRHAAEVAFARFQQLVDRNIELTELKKEALLHRDDAGAFLRLAETFRRAGRNREAAVALEQAAKLRPDDPEIAASLRSLQASLPREEGASPESPIVGEVQP